MLDEVLDWWKLTFIHQWKCCCPKSLQPRARIGVCSSLKSGPRWSFGAAHPCIPRRTQRACQCRVSIVDVSGASRSRCLDSVREEAIRGVRLSVEEGCWVCCSVLFPCHSSSSHHISILPPHTRSNFSKSTAEHPNRRPNHIPSIHPRTATWQPTAALAPLFAMASTPPL
jgi:hypothetical protein